MQDLIKKEPAVTKAILIPFTTPPSRRLKILNGPVQQKRQKCARRKQIHRRVAAKHTAIPATPLFTPILIAPAVTIARAVRVIFINIVIDIFVWFNRRVTGIVPVIIWRWRIAVAVIFVIVVFVIVSVVITELIIDQR